METIVTVAYSTCTHNLGYNVHVVNGDAVLARCERMYDIPGRAAATAVLQKARYNATKIIADEKVMKLIQ